VNEQSRMILAVGGGAVVGGIAGYLLLTEEGRRIRSQIEPTLEEFVRELQRFGGTVNRARSVANEGWQLLNQVAGEAESPAAWNSTIRQQSPF